jgi:hypothetical protein
VACCLIDLFVIINFLDHRLFQVSLCSNDYWFGEGQFVLLQSTTFAAAGRQYCITTCTMECHCSVPVNLLFHDSKLQFQKMDLPVMKSARALL